MKEVASLLGVEIDEEFKVTYIDNYFRITDSRFEIISLFNSEWIEAPASILYELLTGKRKIIKKPWKPKIGEVYFYIDETYTVSWVRWAADFCDFERYAIGNLFSSAEEANKNKEILLENLKDVYYKENPLIKARL